MNANATRVVLCVTVCVVTGSAHAGDKDPYPAPTAPYYALVEKGEARCAVVLSDAPSPVESYAAEELVAYVEKIAGVRPTVVNRADGKLHPIYLGKAARPHLTPPDLQPLGTDGFILKSNPDGIFIT